MKPTFEEVVRAYFHTGANKSQRFGQFFINYYVGDEVLPWPELFYETDTQQAMAMVYNWMLRGTVQEAVNEQLTQETK